MISLNLKKEIMDRSILKSALVSWIQSLEDDELLNKIASLMKNSRVMEFEKEFQVLTFEELSSRINAGIKDIEAGNFISHEDLENEALSW